MGDFFIFLFTQLLTFVIRTSMRNSVTTIVNPGDSCNRIIGQQTIGSSGDAKIILLSGKPLEDFVALIPPCMGWEPYIQYGGRNGLGWTPNLWTLRLAMPLTRLRSKWADSVLPF